MNVLVAMAGFLLMGGLTSAFLEHSKARPPMTWWKRPSLWFAGAAGLAVIVGVAIGDPGPLGILVDPD